MRREQLTEIPDDGIIVLLASENLHHGEKAPRWFDMFRTGQRVHEWKTEVLNPSGDTGYLRGCLQRGTIAVRMPDGLVIVGAPAFVRLQEVGES